jgi:hypothetical protein
VTVVFTDTVALRNRRGDDAGGGSPIFSTRTISPAGGSSWSTMEPGQAYRGRIMSLFGARWGSRRRPPCVRTALHAGRN